MDFERRARYYRSCCNRILSSSVLASIYVGIGHVRFDSWRNNCGLCSSDSQGDQEAQVGSLVSKIPLESRGILFLFK